MKQNCIVGFASVASCHVITVCHACCTCTHQPTVQLPGLLWPYQEHFFKYAQFVDDFAKHCWHIVLLFDMFILFTTILYSLLDMCSSHTLVCLAQDSIDMFMWDVGAFMVAVSKFQRSSKTFLEHVNVDPDMTEQFKGQLWIRKRNKKKKGREKKRCTQKQICFNIWLKTTLICFISIVQNEKPMRQFHVNKIYFYYVVWSDKIKSMPMNVFNVTQIVKSFIFIHNKVLLCWSCTLGFFHTFLCILMKFPDLYLPLLQCSAAEMDRWQRTRAKNITRVKVVSILSFLFQVFSYCLWYTAVGS